MKYVKMYEEFNPNVSKRRNSDRRRMLLDKYKKRPQQIKDSEDKGDELSAELYKKRAEVDRLEIKKTDIIDDIIDIKTKRMKR